MIDYQALEQKSIELNSKIQALTLRKQEIDRAIKTTPIWDDKHPYKETKSEDIGFFRLSKARIILTALDKGRVLRLIHHLGTAIVYMNPQGNSIFVKNEKGNYFNEDNIMNFIVWLSGDWYVLHTPPELE